MVRTKYVHHHVMSATPQSHFVDTLLDEETRAPDFDHHFVVDHYHLYFVLSLQHCKQSLNFVMLSSVSISVNECHLVFIRSIRII